jgi:NAD(P)H dehydrogenase (quinone)
MPMSRIVVTGASGKVGRMIAALLAREGVPQTLLVRDAARAPAHPGADVVVADFRDQDSVRRALRPGDRVFMVSVHEDVETRIAVHQSFVDAAAGVGLGLLAYLSIVKPSLTASFHHGRSHAATEGMILDSGIPYAFLRMNLFLDDLPLWFDPDGVCRGPGGDGRVALISRSDTAAVSAGVLVGPGYENEALDLTGERSHTLGELAAMCSDVLDRPLRYEPGTREAWLESRIRAGVAPWDANIGVGSYEALERGEFDVTSDVVRRVTGRPAESARAWVEANPSRFAALGVDARRARASAT